MTRNRPVGAFGVSSQGDVADFTKDHSTCWCDFCGKGFAALGGVEIYLHAVSDARYVDGKKNPRNGKRTGTGGTICFRCFKAGPQRLADRYEKRAAKLKRAELKEEDLFTARLFRALPDFTGFKRYKLAKGIADAQ